MAEKDNKAQPKTDLTMFLGASITALLKEGYTSSQVKNIVSANLVEEAMKISLTDDGTEYDYHGLKPIFVAINFILKREISKKENDIDVPQIAADVHKLKLITDYLSGRIEKM
jgi:hypothetical protein